MKKIQNHLKKRVECDRIIVNFYVFCYISIVVHTRKCVVSMFVEIFIGEIIWQQNYLCVWT